MINKFLCAAVFTFIAFSLSAQDALSTSVNEQDAKKPDAGINDEQAKKKQVTQTLKISINGIDEQLLENAKAFLVIMEGEGKKVKNANYTQYLAEAGIEEIEQSLKPYGYYQAKVSLDIDKGEKLWTVTYNVEKGTATLTNDVDVLFLGEGRKQSEFSKLQSEFPLQKGDILEQQKYKDFKAEADSLSTTYGYFDADYRSKKIAISDDYRGADIKLHYDTGKRYKFGKTEFKQDFLNQELFERFLPYQEGDKYSTSQLAELQRDLYNSNYVKTIDIVSEPDKDSKTVPVQLKITPKPNKRHSFSVGYGTDTGLRAGHTFDRRWVNKRGHQFNTDLFVAEKSQEFGVTYKIPAHRPATDFYKIFTNVKYDYLNDSKSLDWKVGGAYQDGVGNWSREVGVQWQRTKFTLGEERKQTSLLTPFAKVSYTKVDDPLNIKRGLKVQAELSGGHEKGFSDVTFLKAVADAKAIRAISDEHKVKLYGAVGSTWTKDFKKLPPEYRFFTGGDKTIRGYAYNNIGQRDENGENIGGDKMYFFGAEYEYFFTENIAGAAFVDAGDAYTTESDIKVGAGLGVHYYSPIGPVRLDVAHGFREADDPVRVHLNIGAEF